MQLMHMQVIISDNGESLKSIAGVSVWRYKIEYLSLPADILFPVES